MSSSKVLSREEFARLGARSLNASLTPKQRSRSAKKAAEARWAKERLRAARLLGLAS